MTHALHEVEVDAWAPDDDTFGARLVLIRQRLRWGNVAYAARQCGIPAESWRNWEEGRTPQNLAVVAKQIASRTGCSFQWLIMGPSRAMLASRAQATACYDPAPDWSRVVQPTRPVQTDTVSVDLTRPVEQTRPLPRPRRAVPLLAMA